MKKAFTIKFTEAEINTRSGELELNPTTCTVVLEGDETLIRRITHALEVL